MQTSVAVWADGGQVKEMKQYKGLYRLLNVTMACSLAVSLSLVVTVICSKCVGGLLPILAKMVHLDPAVMASPLITTLVDTVSLLVCFSFSKMILGI